MATPASITFPTYEENFPESSRVLTGRRRGAVKTKTIPSQVSDPASSSKYQRGRNRGAQTERVSRRLETKLVSKYANITTKVRRNDSDSQDDIFITPNVKNAHSQSGAKHTPARSRLYTTPRAQANVKTTGIQHQRKPRHDHAAAVLSTLKAQKNKDLLRSLYKPELIDLVAASEKSTKLRNSLLRSTQQGQHTQHGQTKPATFSSTVSVYDNANSSLVDESVALDSISRRMVALSAAAPNDPALQSSPLVHALSAPLYTNLKPVSGMDRAQLVIEVNHMRRERVEQEREQVKLHIRCAALLRHSKVKPDLQTLQNEIVDLESTLYRLQQQQAERERDHQAALQDKEQEGQQALVEQKRHFQFHTKKHQGDRLDGMLNNLSLENFQLRGNVAKQRLRAKDVHLELQTLRHRTEKLTINLQEARAKSKAQAAKEVELSGELEQVRDDKKNLQKECDRIKWAFQYMRQTFDQQIRTIIDKSKADVKNLSNEHKSLLESYEMDKIKLHEMDKYTEDFSHQRLVLKKLKDEARQNEDRMRAFQRELDKYKQREEQHKQTLDESTKELKKTKKHYRHAIRKLEQAYSVNGKLKAKLQEGVRV